MTIKSTQQSAGKAESKARSDAYNKRLEILQNTVPVVSVAKTKRKVIKNIALSFLNFFTLLIFRKK